jgi:hypothetical protein
MSNLITCPSCNHSFALGAAELEEQKKELRKKLDEYIKKKDSEFELQKQALSDSVKKKTVEEMQAKVSALEEDARLKTRQLQDLQKKELELLRERNDLEQRTMNIEMEIEKRLLEDRKKIEQSIIEREKELFDLRMKEKDTQLDGMKKTIDELKRKSEQGSMQLQGEAQELLLEDMLKEKFPFDIIEEGKKGVDGADCIQIIRNSIGKECGKIIYESKRTKAWNGTWIEKLKNDMRNTGSDMAVLVTQSFPKDMNRFDLKEGVWICSFSEVTSVASVLRHSVMSVSDARNSQENKGDKMQMLYDYMAGNEFRQKWDSIVETYVSMQKQLTDEKVRTQKNWSQRERQLDIILKNAVGFIEDVNVIGGLEIKDARLLEGANDGLLEI